MIQLPAPRLDGDLCLERTILDRRSVREFSDEPLTLGELSDLLWSISGITDEATGYRATPSAGAIFPLELWVLSSRVDGLEPGAWRYVVGDHALLPAEAGDHAASFSGAAFGQACIAGAAVSIVLAADYTGLRETYGGLAERLAWLEMGHAAQNASLLAVARGLGAVCIGAMNADTVREFSGMSADLDPVYAISIGRPA
jgi:SagB-type dehydrogenase family enzyme